MVVGVLPRKKVPLICQVVVHSSPKLTTMQAGKKEGILCFVLVAPLGGRIERRAHAVQLFGYLVVLDTHTLLLASLLFCPVGNTIKNGSTLFRLSGFFASVCSFLSQGNQVRTAPGKGFRGSFRSICAF